MWLNKGKVEALSKAPGAKEAFKASSYLAYEEYVRQVESAKAQETREC